MNPALQLAAALALGLLAYFAITTIVRVRQLRRARERVVFWRERVAALLGHLDTCRCERDAALAERDDALARLDVTQKINADLVIRNAAMSSALRMVRDAVVNA